MQFMRQETTGAVDNEQTTVNGSWSSGVLELISSYSFVFKQTWRVSDGCVGL